VAASLGAADREPVSIALGPGPFGPPAGARLRAPRRRRRLFGASRREKARAPCSLFFPRVDVCHAVGPRALLAHRQNCDLAPRWDRYPPDGNLSKLRDLRFCFAFVLPSVSERRPPNDSQPRARTANSTSCRRGSRPPMSPPSQAGEPTACLTDIRRIPADRTVRPGRRSGCWEVVAECRRGQRNGRRRARTRAPLAGALALARMARA
jgi:hypothetical protein